MLPDHDDIHIRFDLEWNLDVRSLGWGILRSPCLTLYRTGPYFFT